MNTFLSTILAQFVSGFELVKIIATWVKDNEVAALFWGGFWIFILDRFFAWTPTKLDDTVWNVLKQAVANGLRKVGRLP